MIIYHAGKETVEFPEIRKTRFTKDFSWGFYCTKDINQAIRWANRGEGTPVINYYEYKEDPLLKIKTFEKADAEWLDFIASCRGGKTHGYDIVSGPMADDTIWNFVNDYISGNITREQFFVLAQFKYPTHQISFHTLSALDRLTFIKSEVIYD